jgi:hypothetical protein
VVVEAPDERGVLREVRDGRGGPWVPWSALLRPSETPASGTQSFVMLGDAVRDALDPKLR